MEPLVWWFTYYRVFFPIGLLVYQRLLFWGSSWSAATRYNIWYCSHELAGYSTCQQELSPKLQMTFSGMMVISRFYASSLGVSCSMTYLVWSVQILCTQKTGVHKIFPENAPLKTISEVWIHGDSHLPLIKESNCRGHSKKKATDVSRLHQCTCRCYPIFY